MAIRRIGPVLHMMDIMGFTYVHDGLKVSCEKAEKMLLNGIITIDMELAGRKVATLTHATDGYFYEEVAQ